MSRFKFAITALGALAVAACATTPANPPASTGSGTAPTGAQPTPPSNPDGTPPHG